MKRKAAAIIVKYRIWILILMLALAAACVPCIGKTRINYDFTRYLSPDTMTIRALRVMEEEFGTAEQLRVMFVNLDESTLAQRVEALNSHPDVRLASHDPAEGVRRLDGNTYQLVSLTLEECDAPQLAGELRGMFPGEYAVGGGAAAQLDVQRSVGNEIPGVMLIAVGIVVLVLLLTSHAWLEPALILLVLAVSILVNMGTNFIFPDISFITFAVCAILQLALSIDYAIMLLHAYNARRDESESREAAMTDALEASFVPVASSAMTTVAGLLSLLFMSFTIGFDIGLVLSKGILISMVSVFLLMPSVTLVFGPVLDRTRHRPLHLGGDHLARLVYRVRRPLAAALVLCVAAGLILQSGNTYLFTDAGQTAQKLTDSQKIDAVFGVSSPLVLLVPGGEEDADYELQRQLVQRLEEIRINGQAAVGSIAGMVTTGAEALKYYTARDVADLTGQNVLLVTAAMALKGLPASVRADRLLDALGDLAGDDPRAAELRGQLALAREAFNGPNHSRMLLEIRFTGAQRESRETIDRILEAARAVYGQECYLTGSPMSMYDIAAAFEGDIMRVNWITFGVILLIVILSFRSLVLPLILVFVIEGAIWITMGISRLQGQPIFFMCYLICVSLQMGATIDYGILLSSHYRTLRGGGLDVPRALTEAMHKALPTVLTSGIILITAGFIIGKQCSVYYISAIGLLLSRGALVSVCLVLTLLPALLAVLDRWVAGRPRRGGADEKAAAGLQ